MLFSVFTKTKERPANYEALRQIKQQARLAGWQVSSKGSKSSISLTQKSLFTKIYQWLWKGFHEEKNIKLAQLMAEHGEKTLLARYVRQASQNKQAGLRAAAQTKVQAIAYAKLLGVDSKTDELTNALEKEAFLCDMIAKAELFKRMEFYNKAAKAPAHGIKLEAGQVKVLVNGKYENASILEKWKNTGLAFDYGQDGFSLKMSANSMWNKAQNICGENFKSLEEIQNFVGTLPESDAERYLERILANKPLKFRQGYYSPSSKYRISVRTEASVKNGKELVLRQAGDHAWGALIAKDGSEYTRGTWPQVRQLGEGQAIVHEIDANEYYNCGDGKTTYTDFEVSAKDALAFFLMSSYQSVNPPRFRILDKNCASTLQFWLKNAGILDFDQAAVPARAFVPEGRVAKQLPLLRKIVNPFYTFLLHHYLIFKGANRNASDEGAVKWKPNKPWSMWQSQSCQIVSPAKINQIQKSFANYSYCPSEAKQPKKAIPLPTKKVA